MQSSSVPYNTINSRRINEGAQHGAKRGPLFARARPDLKVLFIIGYAENAALRHGHLNPGMHLPTNPFAMEALASKIKALNSDYPE